ncbi:hypothetical protein [Dyella telluris]|uniref:Uncharacterized protein n=1 Tax=Dyella telluris TaxID=2763498 RepID=A0A7G8Q2A4_9GAMM|nr:hypothetical protein [Dyella telluris]QNK00912.1 hypothetical protein H8F01_17820 [Dyella telluris]
MALLPLTLASLSVTAADIDRNDPDRAAILNAARGDENVRFVVKDLVKDGDFAYLCALKQEDGAVLGTDESIDVYNWVAYRQQGGWQALPLDGSLAPSGDKIDCTQDDKAITTAAQIRSTIAARFAANVRVELHDGLSAETRETLRQLIQLGVLQAVDAEEAKKPYSDTQRRVVLDACDNDACRKGNQRAYERLQQMQPLPAISSLVWNSCSYGMRGLNLTLIASCVEVTAPLPVCRPHQRLPNDQKTIENCLAAVRKKCESDVPGADNRKMLCR